MTDVVKPVSTWRIVFAAVLDSLTVLFVGGYVISYATGSTATLGEVHLDGIPALILFAVIIVYFVVGSKYLGGTIWQRILGTRRIGGGSSTPSLPTENTAHQLAAKENTSGQGAAAIIPPELDHWNWGAFLLNWVWGIGNNTFIALLMFVPGVNIVMLFVLGVKGSEWAWRNKRWEDADHFKRVQR